MSPERPIIWSPGRPATDSRKPNDGTFWGRPRDDSQTFFFKFNSEISQSYFDRLLKMYNTRTIASKKHFFH